MWSFPGVSSSFMFFWSRSARLSWEQSGLSPGTDPGRAVGASTGTLARLTASRDAPAPEMPQQEGMLRDVAVKCWRGSGGTEDETGWGSVGWKGYGGSELQRTDTI